MTQAWTAFPNWYRDPVGRHQWRWFDGSSWTEHVASHGYQGVDYLAAPAPPTATTTPAPMARSAPDPHAPTVPTAEVPARIVPTEPASADLRDASVLLVDLLRRADAQPDPNRRSVAIWNPHGSQVGTVRLRPDPAARVIRLLTAEDPTTSARLQILDRDGQTVFTVTRPARHLKVRIRVQDGAGADVGRIVARQTVGRVVYSLEAGDEVLGTVDAPNWRTWQIEAKDASGSTVGRVSRTWEVLAERHFTPPEAYVVQVRQPLADPLRSLVLAALLSVETALQPTPAHAA